MAAAGGTGGLAGGGGGGARASDAAGQSPPLAESLQRRSALPGRPRGPGVQEPGGSQGAGGMGGAPREEAPERPLPFITEPTFSLSLLLRLRSQPGGANLRMGTRPWLPVFPPPLIRSPPPRPGLHPRLSSRRAGSNPAAARGKRPSAWVLLPIGRGKSRPGFQLAGRTVRQGPPTARPRPPPCAL